jgi:hypothetical protein
MAERYSAGVELRRGLDRGRKGKVAPRRRSTPHRIYREDISVMFSVRTATQNLMTSMLDFSDTNTMHSTTLLGQGVDSKPNRDVGSVTESLAGSSARSTIPTELISLQSYPFNHNCAL